MKKEILFGSLVASIIAGAAVASPYDHMETWQEVCNEGGRYIHYDISVEETEEKYLDLSSHWYHIQHMKVDNAEIKYVPTDHDVHRKASTWEMREAAQAECHSNLKDIAYTVEDTVDHNNENILAYQNIRDYVENGPEAKAGIKQIINSFIYDIRWSSSNHSINKFDNGVFKDKAQIFEGRELDNLPNWLRIDLF